MSVWRGALMFLTIILLCLIGNGAFGFKSFYPTINKCCPFGQNFNFGKNKCEASVNPLNATIWNVPGSFSLHNQSFFIGWSIGPPSCGNVIKTKDVPVEPVGTQVLQYFIDNESGNLLETNYNSDNDEFQLTHLPHHYCIDPLEDSLVIRICRPTCNNKEPCIRKCCPLGYHLKHHDLSDNGCVKSEGEDKYSWDYRIYSHPDLTLEEQELVQPRFNVGYTSLRDCLNVQLVSGGWKFADLARPIKVITNGSLAYYDTVDKVWQYLDTPEDYCYEHVEEHVREQRCPGEGDVIYYCPYIDDLPSDNSTAKSPGWGNTVAKVTLVVSIICSLATCSVHLLLLDKLDIHSWVRFSYIFAEFLFLHFFIFTWTGGWNPRESPEGCRNIGIILHFSGLLTLSVFSLFHFDSWWTLKTPIPNSFQKTDVVRFLKYVFIGLSAPSLVVGIGLGIQTYKPDLVAIFKCRADVDKHAEGLRSLYPNYGQVGQKMCFLSANALVPYWFTPLFLLLFLNFLIFIGFSWNAGDNRRRQFATIIQILALNFTAWSIELADWLFSIDGSYHLEIAHHVKAMVLFLILVCKRTTISNVRARVLILLNRPVQGEL